MSSVSNLCHVLDKVGTKILLEASARNIRNVFTVGGMKVVEDSNSAHYFNSNNSYKTHILIACAVELLKLRKYEAHLRKSRLKRTHQIASKYNKIKRSMPASELGKTSCKVST